MSEFGSNVGYVDELYARFLANPEAVRGLAILRTIARPRGSPRLPRSRPPASPESRSRAGPQARPRIVEAWRRAWRSDCGLGAHDSGEGAGGEPPDREPPAGAGLGAQDLLHPRDRVGRGARAREAPGPEHRVRRDRRRPAPGAARGGPPRDRGGRRAQGRADARGAEREGRAGPRLSIVRRPTTIASAGAPGQACSRISRGRPRP